MSNPSIIITNCNTLSPRRDIIDETELAKRRGASLARPQQFSRQNSYQKGGKFGPSESALSLKRTSALESNASSNNISGRNSDYSGGGGGGKFLNFFKSGFHLNKSKSKSKLNLDDNQRSFRRNLKSAKSEENLTLTGYTYIQSPNSHPSNQNPLNLSSTNKKHSRRYSWSQNVYSSHTHLASLNDGVGSDNHNCTPITPLTDVSRLRSLNLNAPNDLTLYLETISVNHEQIYKPLIELDENCWIEPLDPSLTNGLSHCIRITKPLRPSSKSVDINHNLMTQSNNQISKSLSFSSSTSNDRNYNRPHIPQLAQQKESTPKHQQHTFELLDLSCISVAQRIEWIRKLTLMVNPNYENFIRNENHLNIWIQEAKNLSPKKRYFCELLLNDRLYARTSVKVMSEMVFWGEEFDLKGLQPIETIKIRLLRSIEQKKKRDKIELISQINIPVCDFINSSPIEKWFTPSADIQLVSNNSNLRYSSSNSHSSLVHSNSANTSQQLNDNSPMLRIKARYQPIKIYPKACYESLLNLINNSPVDIIRSFESSIKAKSKEDLISGILLVLMNHGATSDVHKNFLADLINLEFVNCMQNEDEGAGMILRGNTMASKAIEVYLKHIGSKYLNFILKDLIIQITNNPDNYEVDRTKLPSNTKDVNGVLEKNQRKLLTTVEEVWRKINSNDDKIPKDLKLVFIKIRDRISHLSSKQREFDMCDTVIDNVISSCLFLRLICPAIMSPFLFGLLREYSDNILIHRAFTLVAKSIQSLANISEIPSQSFDQTMTSQNQIITTLPRIKESYMQFMQPFFDNERENMQCFLRIISSPSSSNNESRSNSGMYQRSKSSSIPVSIMSSKRQIELTEPDVITPIDPAFYLADLTVKLEDCIHEANGSKNSSSINVSSNLLHQNILQIIHDINSYICAPSSQLQQQNKSQVPISDSIKPPRPSMTYQARNNAIKIGNSKSIFVNTPMSSCENEEDFSYIPDYEINRICADSSLPTRKSNYPYGVSNLNLDNDYVAFETLNVADTFNGSQVAGRNSEGSNKDNDVVNSEWQELVNESINFKQNQLQRSYSKQDSSKQSNSNSLMTESTSASSGYSSLLPLYSQPQPQKFTNKLRNSDSNNNESQLSNNLIGANEKSSSQVRPNQLSNYIAANSESSSRLASRRTPNIKRIINNKKGIANSAAYDSPHSNNSIIISKSFDETQSQNLLLSNRTPSNYPLLKPRSQTLSNGMFNPVNMDTSSSTNQLVVKETHSSFQEPDFKVPPLPPKRTESQNKSLLLLDSRTSSLSRSLSSLQKPLHIIPSNNNSNNPLTTSKNSGRVSKNRSPSKHSSPSSSNIASSSSSMLSLNGASNNHKSSSHYQYMEGSMTPTQFNTPDNTQTIDSWKSSLSSNMDLDPLITNETKRCQMLMNLFDIDYSTLDYRLNDRYDKNEMEKYSQRIADEKTLQDMAASAGWINDMKRRSTSKIIFTRESIRKYLPACYRLLHNVQTSDGKIPIDKTVQSIINTNKSIQTIILSSFPISTPYNTTNIHSPLATFESSDAKLTTHDNPEFY